MMTATATLATETIQFTGDGAAVPAYLARPSAAPAWGLPTVVILHEWWGLTDHIKDVARRLAAEGFAALAPDLYARQGSQVTADPNEASSLMSALSGQQILRDLNAATTYLKTRPFVGAWRIGIVGFCMGGTLALNQAGHNSDLKAAVVFYGKVPPIETFDYLLCPVLYHYAEQDGWVTKQEADRMRQGLQLFGKPGEVVTYSCQHAFFNDTRPEVYSAEHAAQAWQKTLQFFAQHLR